MSWLAKSLANSLKLNDDDEEEDLTNEKEIHIEGVDPEPSTHQADPSPSSSSPRGVKEDLSEFTRTLTRQFWGVASFLAPPPQHTSDSASLDTVSDGISGIRNDFAEIGGKLRTGISKLSSNKAVSEITKLASDFLQFVDEEQELLGEGSGSGAVGVTDEVILFARNISMHPETWLDFPLPDYDGLDDFEISEAQYDHALAIERHAPGLSSLRIELCPRYLSEIRFWKIYFVLLHPRLNQHDVQLLSTPEIEDVRQRLLQKLPEKEISKPNPKPISSQPIETAITGNNEPAKPNPEPVSFQPIETTITGNNEPVKEISKPDPEPIAPQPKEIEPSQEHVIVSSESGPGSSMEKYEDDADDWLKDENTETSGAVPLGNEDDVSFSDLEDNDDGVSEKKSFGSDPKDPKDWVDIEEIEMD